MHGRIHTMGYLVSPARHLHEADTAGLKKGEKCPDCGHIQGSNGVAHDFEEEDIEEDGDVVEAQGDTPEDAARKSNDVTQKMGELSGADRKMLARALQKLTASEAAPGAAAVRAFREVTGGVSVASSSHTALQAFHAAYHRDDSY